MLVLSDLSSHPHVSQTACICALAWGVCVWKTKERGYVRDMSFSPANSWLLLLCLTTTDQPVIWPCLDFCMLIFQTAQGEDVSLFKLSHWELETQRVLFFNPREEQKRACMGWELINNGCCHSFEFHRQSIRTAAARQRREEPGPGWTLISH